MRGETRIKTLRVLCWIMFGAPLLTFIARVIVFTWSNPSLTDREIVAERWRDYFLGALCALALYFCEWVFLGARK